MTARAFGPNLEAAILRWARMKRNGIGGAERQQVMDNIRCWAPRNAEVSPEWVMAQADRISDRERRRWEAYERVAPVGLVEIAERLGVLRDTADQWRARGLLPAPRWTVGGRPAWSWEDIADWAEATGRVPALSGGSAGSPRPR